MEANGMGQQGERQGIDGQGVQQRNELPFQIPPAVIARARMYAAQQGRFDEATVLNIAKAIFSYVSATSGPNAGYSSYDAGSTSSAG
ncbi:hypothetical protein FRC07_014677, partial [Ceratobasidium sp. 392]